MIKADKNNFSSAYFKGQTVQFFFWQQGVTIFWREEREAWSVRNRQRAPPLKLNK